MRLVTWNVNGIRSISGGFRQLFAELDADLLCIQETKITKDMLTADIANIDGYNSYFAFCHNAKKGYSGVVTYCSDNYKPYEAIDHLAIRGYELPLGDVEVDDEGRAVITEFLIEKVEADTAGTSQGLHDDVDRGIKLVMVNVYCPRNDPDNPERVDFKTRFHRLLKARVQQYRFDGYHVIIVGDLNIAHKAIDHCEANMIVDFHKDPHRLWMNELFNDGYVDCFREFHPEEQHAYTVWNTQTGARKTNYGTRIDYIITDEELQKMGFFVDCHHMTSVMGSDHCPVIAEIHSNWRIISARELPTLCSKLMPEFRGRQTSIRSFLCMDNSSITSQRKATTETKRKRLLQSSLKTFFSLQGTSSHNGDRRDIPSVEINEMRSDIVNWSETTSVSDSAVEWLETVMPKKRAPENSVFEKMMRKRKIPICSGHGEPAAERTVKKPGPNFNRRFYACARPKGFATDKNARCNFFQWA
uniref:DNA-(apurinic or apyrimidinic site) endonuclease n=2 Tax=Parascaris univalens TaxID=6257 RepID=A0A915BI77_PARUN